jgi:hypothetical protein
MPHPQVVEQASPLHIPTANLFSKQFQQLTSSLKVAHGAPTSRHHLLVQIRFRSPMSCIKFRQNNAENYSNLQAELKAGTIILGLEFLKKSVYCIQFHQTPIKIFSVIKYNRLSIIPMLIINSAD